MRFASRGYGGGNGVIPILTLLLAIVTILTNRIITTHAMVTKGTLSTDSFEFGSKFCFQALDNSDPVGVVEINLVIPTADSNGKPTNVTDIEIVVYDDQEESWPVFLNNFDTWSCTEKVDSSKFSLAFPTCSQPYIKAHPHSLRTNGDQCWSLSPDGTYYTINVIVDTIHQRTRPRYWFFSFANCADGIEGLNYHIHFTQTSQSSWNHEFGSNETGLNSLYLLAFFVFTLLLIIQIYATHKLSRKLQYLHPLIKLFVITLVIEYISILAFLIHYGVYARDGLGQSSLQKMGTVCDIMSRCLFILLLLLIAKGWTISSDRLTHRRSIMTIVAAYFALSISLLFWAYRVADPKQSVPGSLVTAFTIALNVVWFIFGIWFSVQLFGISYRRETDPHKRKMYIRIGFFFAPWLLLPPIASFLSFVLDPWARERIVIAFTVSITVIAYSILTFIFWPKRAEKYFQLSIPDVMDTIIGQGGGINSDYEQL